MDSSALVTAPLSSDVLMTRHVMIEQTRITFRLRRAPSAGFVLERESINSQGSATIQFVPFGENPVTRTFIDGDPYTEKLQGAYHLLLNEAERQSVHGASVGGARLANIADASNEAQLFEPVHRACAAAGAENWFYYWFTLDANEHDIVRQDILVGGNGAWPQLYTFRHGYLSDPAVAYARADASPARRSQLYRLLPRDHWLNVDASAYEIQAGVFFPAHHRTRSTFGLLHVSTSLREAGAEERLWENRPLLRALAADLLDWRMMRQQSGLIRQFDLTQEYLTILWVIDRGGEAQHVASELGISIGAAYRLFRRINEKMDCRHIRASAHKARQLGLLGGYIPSRGCLAEPPFT